MKRGWIVSAVFFIWFASFGFAYADDPLPTAGRLLQLTLNPDYESGTIWFDGTASYIDESQVPVDLTGLPLGIEKEWADKSENTWNIMGTVNGGSIVHDSDGNTYHLLMGPINLRPQDELRFVFPLVNLDYSQIKPLPDLADGSDEIWRRFTHRFSYKAGGENRKVHTLDIPFAPVEKRINLILTPLMGEVLVGKTDGLRFSGRIAFESLWDYEEFSRHCQSTSHRLNYGDYRTAHLLSMLDNPHHSGFTPLNSAYQFKSTSIELSKSELLNCQYNREKGGGRVEAAFSGRLSSRNQTKELPLSLQETDSPDGNYPFEPTPFKGVQGYELRFGKIVLAPGDVLTITVPHVQVQADVLEPSPTTITYPNTEEQIGPQGQIVYHGPKSFDLSIKYVPETQLFFRQFPAFLRPGIKLFERQFGGLLTRDRSLPSWLILVDAFLALIVWILAGRDRRWFGFLAWFLGSVGLLYGLRGSFGLLFIAVAMYLSYVLRPKSNPEIRPSIPKELAKGLAICVLISAAIFIDGRATNLFKDLSTSDLSPLTPVILVVLTGIMLFLLYGWPQNLKHLKDADVPVLAFFLVILCTYDALDKSLLALLIIGLVGVYIVSRLAQLKNQENNQGQISFGEGLRYRLEIVLENNFVPISIAVLIFFAVLNDLAGPYANQLQIAMSWIAAPLLPPLLIFVSTALTLTSIACLFILLYPVIPFEAGYLKAVVFSLILFLIFLFGLGTDDRLIDSLETILVGRVLYYLSVPLLLGIYFDAQGFVQQANHHPEAAREAGKRINLQAYFEQMQGKIGALTGIISVVTPPVYAFLFDQPAIVTYFGLLEKLVLLPV